MQIFIDLDYTLLDVDKFKLKNKNIIGDLDFRDILYSDSLEFINYASKYGIPTLFSEGEIKFQREKVEKTGLEKIFGNNIKIYPSYEKIFELPEIANSNDVVLIDDKPEIIDRAISLGIKVVRIKRGKFKDVDSKKIPYAEVKSLEEIIKKDLLSGL
jgi:methionine salvage enolase-phosphatase E1